VYDAFDVTTAVVSLVEDLAPKVMPVAYPSLMVINDVDINNFRCLKSHEFMVNIFIEGCLWSRLLAFYVVFIPFFVSCYVH